MVQCLPMQSRIACTDDGCISDGVPPPNKMLDTVRPGARAAIAAISDSYPRINRASSIPPWRTWLLKSQYGHLDRQNGQCTYTPKGVAPKAPLAGESVMVPILQLWGCFATGPRRNDC